MREVSGCTKRKFAQILLRVGLYFYRLHLLPHPLREGYGRQGRAPQGAFMPKKREGLF